MQEPTTSRHRATTRATFGPTCAVEHLESRTLCTISPIHLPPISIYDPGSTFATAQNLGTVDGGKAVTGSVGLTDLVDTFKFKAPPGGHFVANLTGLSRDAKIQIFDAAQHAVPGGLSDNLGAASEQLSLNLSGGATYYAKVSFVNRLAVPPSPPPVSTKYVLTMTGQDIAGNSVATALDLGDITRKTIRRIDFVGASDLVDYYKMSISEYQDFTITLKHLSADADIEFLDNTGSSFPPPAPISDHSGTADESLTFGVHGGTYYLKVTRWSGDTNYDLIIKTKDFLS